MPIPPSMDAAQWLIATIGFTLAVATFVLMRFPAYRRQQYRGEPFSLAVSLAAAGVMLALCLAMVWAQGEFSPR
ncbi:MAG: hypothetical protein AB7O32_11410 [Vicinamibacterales bacterium]